MKELIPHLPEIFILIFLTFHFGISLFEKICDWHRIFSFYESSFKKTFLKNFIRPLIVIMMGLEFLNFFFLSIGLYQLIKYQETETAVLAFIFSSLTIFYTFSGQRVAKNYAAANSLSIYFIISVLGLFLFS
jgi:hypothetical protein